MIRGSSGGLDIRTKTEQDTTKGCFGGGLFRNPDVQRGEFSGGALELEMKKNKKSQQMGVFWWGNQKF